MTEVQLGYGRGSLSFVHDEARYRLLTGDPSTNQPLTDVEIGDALSSPIESPPDRRTVFGWRFRFDRCFRRYSSHGQCPDPEPAGAQANSKRCLACGSGNNLCDRNPSARNARRKGRTAYTLHRAAGEDDRSRSLRFFEPGLAGNHRTRNIRGS